MDALAPTAHPAAPQPPTAPPASRRRPRLDRPRLPSSIASGPGKPGTRG